VLRSGDLELDPATRSVRRGDTPINLSAKEFSLLEFLMRHPGEVLSRNTILEHVWDFAYEGVSNVVDVYIRYVREKIDRPFDRHSIETVRGAGYRFVDEIVPAGADGVASSDGGARLHDGPVPPVAAADDALR
jgi:two-component system OmpR family response regulator